jgi:hypothetical protein
MQCTNQLHSQYAMAASGRMQYDYKQTAQPVTGWKRSCWKNAHALSKVTLRSERSCGYHLAKVSTDRLEPGSCNACAIGRGVFGVNVIEFCFPNTTSSKSEMDVSVMWPFFSISAHILVAQVIALVWWEVLEVCR